MPATRAIPRTLVIVNPAAGRGRAKRAQPVVADYLREHGLLADFVESQSGEDIERRAAEAAAGGYGCVAVLGGDGAFHHLVRGAFGHNLVLGFFPAGHGNDIADALRIPKDAVAAAHAFLTGRPRNVDVVRARLAQGRTGLYVGAGGMGLDAEAALLANGRFRRLPGAARYVAAALWALTTFEPLRLEVELDGERAAEGSGPVILAAVANAPRYGSGVWIAPMAKLDDGLLDVTLVSDLPWTRLLEAIPVLLRTGDLRWPEIRRYRARRVRLAADRPALFHGDGELLGTSPVELEVLPGAVQVMAPSK